MKNSFHKAIRQICFGLYLQLKDFPDLERFRVMCATRRIYDYFSVKTDFRFCECIDLVLNRIFSRNRIGLLHGKRVCRLWNCLGEGILSRNLIFLFCLDIGLVLDGFFWSAELACVSGNWFVLKFDFLVLLGYGFGSE